MGLKCFKAKESKSNEVSYPKFTYLSTEACVMIKFTSPNNKEAKKILMDPNKRLPTDALVCKISTDYFFIAGGINLFTWSRCAESYELQFQHKTILKKDDCPFIPHGGSLYVHEMQVYLVGSTQSTAQHNEADFDPDNPPEPFKPAKLMPIDVYDKCIKPAPILRFSIARGKWKEVKISPENFIERNGVTPEKSPDQLYLPGTCKMDNKIMFIGGLVLNEEELVSNEDIYTFDLDKREVMLMKVRFDFGPLTELKCSRATKKRIIILGGYDKEMNYNKLIFRYTVDLGLKAKHITLPDGCKFADNNNPIGKYRFSVFFGYPLVFLTRFRTDRREYINITAQPPDERRIEESKIDE